MAQQRLPILNSDNGTWGKILNDFLLQTSANPTGGLNTFATPPTQSPRGGALGVDDTGYTYINTTDNTIKKWNGMAWVDVLKTTTSSGGMITTNILTGILDESIVTAPVYKITSTINGISSNTLSIPLEPVVVVVP
jgi:hypothetical protein